MFYPNKYAWSPKYIEPLGVVAFLYVVIFNKAEFKIRFLDWGLGALVLVTTLAFFIVRRRIAKKELLVIGMPLIWMVYALLGTPFVFNFSHHVASLTQAFVLTLIATFLVISVFTRRELIAPTVLLTAIIWTLINFAFFLAWSSDYFSYEKGDFAGLFRNRNEFAVQTVIIIAMLLAFVKQKRFVVWGVIGLNAVMVTASHSVKGFLFFLFVLFFPLFLKGDLKKKVVVLVIGLGVLTAAYNATPNLQERITRFSMVFNNPDDLRQSESAFLRSWLMVEGASVALDNPVFGVGVGNSSFVLIPPLHYQQGSEQGLVSHNNYIEMLLNAGFIGFSLHYLPLLFIYFRLKKSHPYFIPLKTFIVLYLLLGIAMVQYNNFISIMMYCLIIFHYFLLQRVSPA